MNSRETVGPLTFGQKWLVEAVRQSVVSGGLNLVSAVDLPSGTKVAQVLDVFEDLAARHAALRTTFLFNGQDVPCAQIVWPDINVPCIVSDQSVESLPRSRDSAIQALVTTGFELARSVGWRAQILAVASVAKTVVLSVHHLVADCVALATLRRELLIMLDRRHASLSPTESPIELATSQASGEVVEASIAAEFDWTGLLSRPELLPKPIRPPSGSARRVVRIDFGELSASLHEIARDRGFFTSATLVAMAALCWTQFHRRPRVAATLLCTGRPTERLDRCLSSHVQPVPLSLEADEGLFVDFIEKVQEAMFEANFSSSYDVTLIEKQLGGDRLNDVLDFWINVMPEAESDHETPQTCTLPASTTFGWDESVSPLWPGFYCQITIGRHVSVRLALDPAQVTFVQAEKLAWAWHEVCCEVVTRPDCSVSDIAALYLGSATLP
ncbi:condensation domain-containing protein [Microlunatus speluncae]|uniref:condensation domain-containing protein n=1 Tax=Microlunatus speluncae TaxID=2594267 RepID=UPI0012667A7F|nr:condensation domain-containing protein [Microlunatus speluncae]